MSAKPKILALLLLVSRFRSIAKEVHSIPMGSRTLRRERSEHAPKLLDSRILTKRIHGASGPWEAEEQGVVMALSPSKRECELSLSNCGNWPLKNRIPLRGLDSHSLLTHVT